MSINENADLVTFDSKYVQIDACPTLGGNCSGGMWAGDANLYAGPDHDYLLPSGGPSLSINYPSTINTTGTFTDWIELIQTAGGTVDTVKLANHFRSDYASGPDPTAFPGSNSCVGPANVLDKMNLTFLSVSNNGEYAYFGVQRRDNNGDTGYMWIFNRLAPPTYENGASDGLGDNCASTDHPLTFKVSSADVLFRGHFAPSSEEPLLSVYKVRFAIGETTKVKDGNTVYSSTRDSPTEPWYILLPAKSAINWELTLVNPLDAKSACSTTTPEWCFWQEKSDYVAAAAVTTSIAGLGELGTAETGYIGSAGLKSPMAKGAVRKVGTGASAASWRCDDDAGCMQENLFAEVAVKISAFVGSDPCDASFYGSVISRSSGTTPSPDMKDLSGPHKFNFLKATVTAVVTPTCGTDTGAEFKYRLGTFTGAVGTAVTPTSCEWFVDGVTTGPPSTCNTTDVLTSASEGSHNVKVAASDGQCTATSQEYPVSVWKGPKVSATLTSDCTNYGTAAAPKAGFGFGAAGSQTHGTVSYLWTFAPSTVTLTFTSGSTTSTIGTATFPVSASYLGSEITGNVELKDVRDTLTCKATDEKKTTPHLPLDVLLSSNAPRACNTNVTFTATPSGGSGAYNYNWNLDACDSFTTCEVTPATLCEDDNITVTLTDGACPSQNPTAGLWLHKTTGITVDNVPPSTLTSTSAR